MSVEILAPCGSKEALDAAIAAGADAVYFGMPNFGARAYASNFTLEETKEALQRLHLAGMKGYITMNTILYEDEMEAAFDQAKALYELGVDALIIQDLGLIHLLHERIPDLVLHASTQLSVSRPEQIEMLKKLGVSRVVLARECTLEEIKACAKTGMEIEAFIHGALCISYSGQCQFSAVRMNRSGNRGKCAQPCRMRYTLKEDGKPIAGEQFLISPKDLSLIQDVKALTDAGVISLKIEGRMKSAEYVYESVEKTRQVLQGRRLSKKDQRDLSVVFSRGFTKGHAFSASGNDLMNTKSSNHQGIKIGTVLSSRNRRVKIRLEEDLNQHDGLRFEKGNWSDGCYANFIYDSKGKLTAFAKAGSVVEVESSNPVPPQAIVKKTIDAALKKSIEEEIRDAKIQIPVSASVSCKGLDEPLVLTIDYQNHHVEAESDQKAVRALKRASDEEVIRRQMEKTGDSFAFFNKLTVCIPDGLFFPLPAINNLRRAGLEKLKQEILKIQTQPIQPYKICLEPETFSGILFQIQNRSQRADIDDVIWISEFPLPKTERLSNLRQGESFAVTHLVPGELIFNMNVTNSYAAAALMLLGYKGILLSDELSLEQTQALTSAFKTRYGFDAPLIVTIYQKRRLMLMKHCPVNTALKDGTRKNCSLCHTKRYTMEGMDESVSILEGDSQCNMQIFDSKTTDLIEDIPLFTAMGIDGFLVKFVDEGVDDIIQVYDELR